MFRSQSSPAHYQKKKSGGSWNIPSLLLHSQVILSQQKELLSRRVLFISLHSNWINMSLSCRWLRLLGLLLARKLEMVLSEPELTTEKLCRCSQQRNTYWWPFNNCFGEDQEVYDCNITQYIKWFVCDVINILLISLLLNFLI